MIHYIVRYENLLQGIFSGLVIFLLFIPKSCHDLPSPPWTNTKIADDSNATVWDTVKMLKIVAKNIQYNSAEKSKLWSGNVTFDQENKYVLEIFYVAQDISWVISLIG